MKLIESILDRRVLAAVLSGFLLTAAFPGFGVAGLAWVAPGLMMVSAAGVSGRGAFKLGYIAGLAHFLSSLSWLLAIPFPAGAVVGWLALSAFIALYPACWVWLCWRIFPRRDGRCNTESTFLEGLETLARASWVQRAGWAVFAAASWVAMEMIRSRFLSGFPWNPLGASQHRMVPMIQIASVTGVYGLSFVCVWFAVALAGAAVVLTRRPDAHRAWLAEVVLPLAVAMAVAGQGMHRVLQAPSIARTKMRLALIQPSIPQTLIFDPTETTNRFRQLIELSNKALAEKPDVLIWPEAAMPGIDDANYRAITNLIVRHRIWMIFGADDPGPELVGAGEVEPRLYNAAVMFGPDGGFVASYHKRRLVMFGEYLPGAGVFPFLRKVVPIPGDFTPGDRPGQFVTTAPRVKMAPIICFEDAFPHAVREHLEDDTDFLLNLTNDGWFGEGAAQWQQGAMALFRAVENGVPLVRCTNNGLTCWIDEMGRMQDWLGRDSGRVHAAGYLIIEVPVGRGLRETTFYRRHGDWFGWGCVAVAGMGLGLSGVRRRERDAATSSTP